MRIVWIGVDVGRYYHHVAAVTDDDLVVYSQQAANDEYPLSAVIDEITGRWPETRWAVDLVNAPASPLLTILHDSHVDVAYVSRTLTAHLSKVFHGDRKTDAADAETIARIRRFRRDLRPLAALGKRSAQRCMEAATPTRHSATSPDCQRHRGGCEGERLGGSAGGGPGAFGLALLDEAARGDIQFTHEGRQLLACRLALGGESFSFERSSAAAAPA